VDLFRAETQEEFAGVKLRLLRIEQKLDDHEARISALEQR
jgi:BMFP domain-containing protein YqiC